MKFLHLVSFLSCALLAFGGECLTDWNTGQPSSAWNTRLWSYSPTTVATPSASSTLTFMSYNLQSSISNACVSNPQNQASLMTTDYVGNQEVVQGVDTRCNCNMPQIIADATGKSTRFVMTFPWRTGQYGIQAGTSQTIVDTKYLLYTYANAEQRALVALKTLPPALGGKALWFISTHLDYTVWAARQAEAQQLVAWVRTNIIAQDSTASVVVVGDFNGNPDDGYYGIMKGLFQDAWEVFTGSPANGYTYPSDWPNIRFDHVFFYTPASVTARVTNVEVINSQDSDHRPLKATIQFTTASSTTAPTAAPTAAPTKAATSAPTAAPTTAPTPAPTAAPTRAPTAAPTSAPTAAPTSAPTAAPTAAPASSGSCAVTVSYNTVGNNIVITNTGSKAIKTLQLTFSPSVPSNNWNLVSTSTSNVYSLPDWAYQSLNPGQVYTSSGYYTGASHPTITASRVSC